MKINAILTTIMIGSTFALGAPRTHAYSPDIIGLYDSDNKDITSGDLNSQDYWWTKFDAMMLDIAVKQRQPEGPIAVNTAVTLRRIDDLLKKYPKHQDILAW